MGAHARIRSTYEHRARALNGPEAPSGGLADSARGLDGAPGASHAPRGGAAAYFAAVEMKFTSAVISFGFSRVAKLDGITPVV